LKTNQEREVVGEVIDRVVSIPLFFGGSFGKRPVALDLYDAARQKFNHPLTYLAAERLVELVKPGDSVIITAGFVVPPWFSSEHDGPIGALTLARALNISFDATPVIVTEELLVENMTKLCQTSGFRVYDYEKAKSLPRRMAVEPFTLNEDEAKSQAEELIDKINPTAIIAIEKPSRNSKGQYHAGMGLNLTSVSAKVDHLFDVAKSRGILTIGIGDGGNEIGMGCIKDTVKKVVPTGSECGCPCAAGTFADTETDVLISAGVSNWGAYGLEAALAHSLERTEVMHDPQFEKEVVENSGRAGFVSPSHGFGIPWVDHISLQVQVSIVEILNYLVHYRVDDSFVLRKYKEYMADRTSMQETIDNWKNYV